MDRFDWAMASIIITTAIFLAIRPSHVSQVMLAITLIVQTGHLVHQKIWYAQLKATVANR